MEEAIDIVQQKRHFTEAITAAKDALQKLVQKEQEFNYARLASIHLVPDVIQQIAQHMDDLYDFASVRLVCTAWNQAIVDNAEAWKDKQWLFFFDGSATQCPERFKAVADLLTPNSQVYWRGWVGACLGSNIFSIARSEYEGRQAIFKHHFLYDPSNGLYLHYHCDAFDAISLLCASGIQAIMSFYQPGNMLLFHKEEKIAALGFSTSMPAANESFLSWRGVDDFVQFGCQLMSRLSAEPLLLCAAMTAEDGAAFQLLDQRAQDLYHVWYKCAESGNHVKLPGLNE